MPEVAIGVPLLVRLGGSVVAMVNATDPAIGSRGTAPGAKPEKEHMGKWNREKMKPCDQQRSTSGRPRKS